MAAENDDFQMCRNACKPKGILGVLLCFILSLVSKEPKSQLDHSLIRSSPALEYMPKPPEGSSLIWYKVDHPKYLEWTNSLDKFLTPYTEPDSEFSSVQMCDFDTPSTSDKACKVDISQWTPCVKENYYNFQNGAPCIFLTLNKMLGWIPEFYNDTETLPDNMPEDLKHHIKSEWRRYENSLNTVWVSCEGEDIADKENIGPIQYIPRRGFSGYYFPYNDQDGYLSPLVAVWFEKPTRGVLIKIECKAWARNIHYDRTRRLGSVYFELMVD